MTLANSTVSARWRRQPTTKPGIASTTSPPNATALSQSRGPVARDRRAGHRSVLETGGRRRYDAPVQPRVADGPRRDRDQAADGERRGMQGAAADAGPDEGQQPEHHHREHQERHRTAEHEQP